VLMLALQSLLPAMGGRKEGGRELREGGREVREEGGR
jgi:hypothetical protein